MTSSQHGDDTRWDNRVPWYLRHPGATVNGNVDLWLDLVGQRIERLFNFNECGVLNEPHFGSCIETETLGRFKFTWGPPLGSQLKAFLEPTDIRRQAESDALADPEDQRAQELSRLQGRRGPTSPALTPQLNTEAFLAQTEAKKTRPARTKKHWATRVNERISTLEAVMRIHASSSSATTGLKSFVADVRRICAAAHVPLDIRGLPPLICPLEEPLLQREVIEPLLTRLAARWPDRAKELVTAYHDVVAGKPLDEVFSSAFKSVEEIARALTGNPKFDFSESDLDRHFASLHPTIKAGIIKLRAHRGAAAAHGRNPPDSAEIRYLLFQICNLALLLLDTEPGD
jgi:hypothetical protein